MSTRERLVFVDAVEEGRARLLFGEESFSVPLALLPDGAREGTWLRVSLAIAPPPDSADSPDALRRKLGKGDPGGPIKL